MKRVICILGIMAASLAVFGSLVAAQNEGQTVLAWKFSENIKAGSMAFDAQGNLYIIDGQNAKVYRLSSNGTISPFAGKGRSSDGFSEFSGDGGPALEAGLGELADIIFDRTGVAYLSDWYHNRIRKIDLSGVITTLAGRGSWRLQGFNGDGGPATQALLSSPNGIAVDRDGNIYIADTWNHRIRRVDPNGVITTFAGSGPVGTDSTGKSLGSFAGDGGLATQARLNLPNSVAIDAIGNVYLAGTDRYQYDTVNHRIRKVDKNGIISTFAGVGTSSWEIGNYIKGEGGPAVNAYLNNPSSLAIDAAGNIFFADESLGGLIAKVSANGTINVVAMKWPLNQEADTQGYPFIPLPGAVSFGWTIDASGFLYVSIANRIYRIKPWGDQIASSQKTFTVKPWRGDVPGSLVFLSVGPVQPPPVVIPPTPTPPPVVTQPPPTTGLPSLNFRVTNTTGVINSEQGGFAVRFFLEVSNVRIQSIKWDFGDGATSKEPHPEHLYRSAGIYTVTVAITTESGEVITKTKEKFITVTSAVLPPRLEPKIYVSQDSLDFRSDGVTRIGIAIINSGLAPLEITRVVIGGRDSLDFSASPTNLMIEVEKPGPQNNVGKVSIVFAPQTAGEKRARLFLYHNAPNSPAVVELRGISVVIPEIKPTPDFNGDGWVDFDDFFLFADVFGKKNVALNSPDTKFDFNRDGEIGFGDFFIFAESFGKEIK
ncbi:MAG: PKD domain-containing protein [Patescibacteria group bacterium]